MDWKRLFHRPASTSFYHLEYQAFSAKYLLELKTHLLQSPYLAQNVLNQRFATTQGFSVIFNAQRVSDLNHYFPWLKTWQAKILRPEYNLYYLNALCLGPAGHVERHIDHSIRGYGADLPYPLQVSVLYVSIPKMQGGEFLLFDPQEKPLLCLRPESGMLLTFRGDLKHLITPIQHIEFPQTPRLSLVCEQYVLKAKDLDKVPAFTLKSTVDFQTFLQAESDTNNEV